MRTFDRTCKLAGLSLNRLQLEGSPRDALGLDGLRRYGGEVRSGRLIQQCVAHMADLKSTVLHRTAYDHLAVAGLTIDLAAVSTM